MPSIDISQYKFIKPIRKDRNSSLSSFLNRDISFSAQQLPDKKKEMMYAEISTLLASGVDLKTTLELVLSEQKKNTDKLLFGGIKNNVLGGKPLSESLKMTGKFSDYEYFSIRIGEETGRISEVLANLSAFYKSKIHQRRKIISAITYPAIVLMTSMGAVLFMIKFVVPMFADVFLRFGGELPWLTASIIRLSKFTDAYFIYFFFLCIVIAVCIFSQRKKILFRKISSAIILQLPVAGDIVRKIYLARFSNTMRLLVSTNTPLLRSIVLVRQMISYYPIEHSLVQVEKDILKGDSLHASLSRFDFYPSRLIQLIRIGEEVNKLDFFFEKIAVQYTEEVEYRTNTISSLLEPLFIIFLGIVVGAILIAMYLPMFQMTNNF